jgi:hypothetical protein
VLTDKPSFCKSFAEDYAALLKHTGEFNDLNGKSRRGNKDELLRLHRTIAGIYWGMKRGLNSRRGIKLLYEERALEQWLLSKRSNSILDLSKWSQLNKEEKEKASALAEEIGQKERQREQVRDEYERVAAEEESIFINQKELPRIDLK